jgi:hypothetical protein
MVRVGVWAPFNISEQRSCRKEAHFFSKAFVKRIVNCPVSRK